MQATGSKSSTELQKLPEGNFSKVFLMKMDEKDVIAKLPNPNAGRPHFTTASEVATMEYLREILNVPSPKVHAWSSSSNTPVGAECIIMYGSLYYAKDLPQVQPEQFVDIRAAGNTIDSVFAVVPTTNRTFFDHGRDFVDVDRGPSNFFHLEASAEDYFLARVYRELTCMESSTSFPRPQGFFYGSGQYRPSIESKLKALRDYIHVAPLLLPKDQTLSQPTLWHPDLHGDSIFVNPDRPTEILSTIDWQAVNLAPLFLQVHHLVLVEFEGPVPDGLGSIKLPDNFDDLSPEKQLEAKKLRAAQSLYKLYDIQLLQQCPEIAQAMHLKSSFLGQVVGLAGSVFTDGEPILQGMLIRLKEGWSKIIGESIPCPLSFSVEEKERQREDEAKWASGVELMEGVLDQIGAYQGWDGWVNYNGYEPLKKKAKECQKEFLDRYAQSDQERCEWMAVWPFADES
ncbi:phosphotransferase enzyme family protein [Penicillium capsulatum]|uniref:Altered inheritance of mitochondria protein 9, mitochondrial n=1 Tax=Penicillium capsulatum TaxID=69766 RepID=A0A9W9HP58_9EURO|nr:phosphotransferase enzyme family protein [Penicillium capsulatum]